MTSDGLCVLCKDPITSECPTQKHCAKHHEIYGQWTN